MAHIFIVDGVPQRRNLACYALEMAGYEVEAFASERDLESTHREVPDLFLIAVRLRNGSGMDLCCRLKKLHAPHSPRIILVAENREEKYRAIVESEADDFITSPLAPDELVSCVQSLLGAQHRVSSTSAPHEAEIVIDCSAMTIRVGGNEIPTTTLEFRLIDYMSRNSRKVLTRDALLDAVWGNVQFVAHRSVDACVGRIRRKIEPNPFCPIYLTTVRGIGYRLEADADWLDTSTGSCECASCSVSRARPRMRSEMRRRRVAT